MEVGLKIKNYLNEHGISQTFISRKTGLSLQKLNRSLNGFRKLTFDEYVRICDELGVSTAAFLEARTG